MKMMKCLVGHRGYSALSSRIRNNDGDDNYNVTVFLIVVWTELMQCLVQWF